MSELIDSHGRKINYIRVSVTDRCNLRCIYCMKKVGLEHMEREEILSFEEIENVIRIAVRLGISKVRLTGGEPLVRKGFINFVENVSKIEGIKDLSLTTNGSLLERYAEKLKKAGIRRVNISLDTLKPERYKEITTRGEIIDVFKGIEAARKFGIKPVKINVVVIRGMNDDEIANFAKFAFENDLNVRFIEYMPVGATDLWDKDKCVSVDEMLNELKKIGKIEKIGNEDNGPAEYYKFEGKKGKIGLISPISNHFCSSCNKLRLTADGRLRKCLFSDEEVDIRKILRSVGDGDVEKEVEEAVLKAVSTKPEKLDLERLGELVFKRTMSQIGG